MADPSRYFQDLISGKACRLRDRLLLRLLRALSRPYASILSLRAAGYRRGIFRSHRLPVPVISIGNIALGGTGKTPMTMLVARYFLQKGKRVAVLSRGYGGSAQGTPTIVSDGSNILVSPEVSGDEPYLLAHKVPGLMVVVGADRYRAGMLAMAELKPDLFILDDGFQHLKLQRDLNILLLHAAAPFSNGCTLPAGYLREKPDAAERADVAVYTRARHAGVPNVLPHKPSFWMQHALTSVVPLQGGEPSAMDRVCGMPALAFSGIADPAAFFGLLEECGVELAATLPLADHAEYGEAEVAAILRLKASCGAQVLITTEKDAVKLAAYRERLEPCYAAQLEMVNAQGAALEAFLEKVLW